MASRNQTNHYRPYASSSSTNTSPPGRTANPTLIYPPDVPLAASVRNHYLYPSEIYYSPAPAPVPAPPAPAPPPPTVDVDHLVLRIFDSISPSLKAIHDLNQRVGTTQATAMAALSKQQTEMRAEFDEKVKKLHGTIDNLKNVQAQTLKSLAAFSEHVGEAVGIGSGRSLLSRMEEVRLNVGEMYERSKDPDANVDDSSLCPSSSKGPEIIILDTPEPEPEPRINTSVVQTPKLAPLLREFKTVMVGTTPPPLESIATSPLRDQVISRATSPRTPSPQRAFASVEVCTSPLLSQHVEKGVDPINVKYMEAAVDATPMVNGDVESTFPSSYKTLSMESSTQIADDGASVVRPPTELGETVDVPVNLDEFPALEYIDDPISVISQTDKHSIEHQESHFARCHCKVKSNLLYEEENSFSPVDWSNEVVTDPTGASSGTGGTKKQMSVFRPDASPEVTKNFSVLKDQDHPPDGTVASLRRDALGDSFAGPLTSTPTGVLPYYSRPSVSPPLPSPATSRSPSPTMNGNHISSPASDPKRASSKQPSADLITAVEASAGSPCSPALDPKGTSSKQPSVDFPVETSVGSPCPLAHSPAVSPRLLVLSPTTLDEEELVSESLVMQTDPSVHESPVASASEGYLLEQNLTTDDLPEESEALIDCRPSSIPPSTTSSYPIMSESATANASSTDAVYSPPGQNGRGLSPIIISSASPSPEPVKQTIEHFPVDDDDTPIISATKMQANLGKSKAPDANAAPPRVNLIVRDSGKAATRVRKRKETTKEEEEEPPLKRARQRGSSEKGKILTTPKRKKEEVKEKGDRSVTSSRKKGKQKKSSIVPVKWPKIKPSNDETLDRKFIKCDMCLVWYHYGCVGIRSLSDNRLKSSYTYACPPCDVGSTSTRPVRTDQASCARPDCTLGTTNENEFYVAGVIGRKTKVEGGYGRKYMWLLKWEGYPVSASTWEGEESMADPQTLIEEFEEAAVKEGFHPEEDPYCTILLQEAKNAGWKSDEDAD